MMSISPLPRAAEAQPTQGNWLVAGTQVVQNESISLNGNLTVQAGGSLTLDNVNLTIDAGYDGQYGISVLPGGSMYVYNSTIAGSNPAGRYSFVENGNNFVMKGSQLHGVGWCSAKGGSFNVKKCLPGGQPDHQFTTTVAPLVESDNALIEDNTFSRNAMGLIIGGSNITVKGNVFQSNDFAAFGIFSSSADHVTSNSFEQDLRNTTTYLMQVQYTNNSLIAGNTMLNGNLSGVPPNQWMEHEGTGIGSEGITLLSSYNNVVTSDNISAANIAVFLVDADNNTISNNALIAGENGVNTIGHAVDTKILSNTIVGGLTAGVTLDLSHGSVVANNTISGDMTIGLQADHTSNSTFLNNDIRIDQSGQVGLYLSSSRNDELAGNTISGALQGILIYDTSNNNTVHDSEVGASYSIVIEGSSGNLIYGNNFHDLKPPAGGPVDNGNNVWNNGTVGNYWSYYMPANLGACRSNQPSCFVGSETYVRTVISPSGKELYSVQTPFVIQPVPMVHLTFVPFPQSSQSGSSIGNVIKNEVVEVDSGDLTGGLPGNLTIINSTLILGRTGTVNIVSPTDKATVLIKNSKILDAGYGSSLTENQPSQSLVITNSVLVGVYTQDLGGYNITIRNSLFLSSQEGYGITVPSATFLSLTNDTFSYNLVGIGVGCPQSTRNIAISGNTVLYPIKSGISTGACSSNIPVLVSDNTVVGAWGLGIAATNGETITGNNITESHTPLIVNSANVIVNNTISNSFVALSIYQGSGNTVYHNNFINDSFFPGSCCSGIADSGGQNIWAQNGEGNYWSNYAGKDSNLDGIGDTPLVIGNGEQDSYPFMQPNGWLTKFHLTLDTNLPASTAFQINGTSFSVSQGGTANLRLGYFATYSFGLPQTVQLANGSTLNFSRWADGVTSATRTLKLSGNSTLEAVYVLGASTTTTAASSSSTTTTPIPEFPVQSLITTLAFSITAAVMLFARSQKRNMDSRSQS